MAAPPSVDYPVQLGIAYLFLVGYLVRTLFVSVRLPASVGVILTGFSFSFFIQTDILIGRDLLQQHAFFLVLLTAGLEITLEDLTPSIILCACLPATFEIFAIMMYGVLILNYTVIEAVVMGTVLVAIGDGLVIPKMKEFATRFPGHPLPRLVFIWAPLEASFVLTLFGILVGLSDPANQPSVNLGVLVLANITRLVATVVAGAGLGAASGWLIPRRMLLTLNGQQVFTGAPVESFLMILAVALLAFGLGAGEAGKEMVPMGFSSGSLFQPELIVIITGTFFAAVADHEVLHDVECILGGVWVFGQLILFSMLGSRTTPGIFPQFQHVVPIIFVGLIFRFTGVYVALSLTKRSRESGDRTSWHDVFFCFLSTIPRATIQGALGAVPVNERFFQHCPHKHEAQDFIFIAARLYIVGMSVVGMILLNIIGPQLLQATSDRYVSGGSAHDVGLEASRTDSSNTDVNCAMGLICPEDRQYSVDLERFTAALAALRLASHGKACTDEDLCDMSIMDVPAMPWARSISAPPAKKSRGRSEDDLAGIQARARRRHSLRRGYDLALAQFDVMGPLESIREAPSSWRKAFPFDVELDPL